LRSHILPMPFAFCLILLRFRRLLHFVRNEDGGCFASLAMTFVASLLAIKLQSRIKVFPVFVGFFNQINFLSAGTSFYLLFPGNCFMNINEFFIKNQFVNIVNRGETIRFFFILCSSTLLFRLFVIPV
jgi:hypothetical protein